MRIAITGGIGAGKSHVCRRLATHGIAVYDCDAAAKRLMRTSPHLQQALRHTVGPTVYDADGKLRKQVLAAFLLASEANKQAIDDIVHPAVALDFMASGLEWLESAILFDSGFHRRVAFDHVVCVTAPAETRLRRIMARDAISREQAQAWIDRQLPQAEVVSRSDYEVVNDGICDLDSQLAALLHAIYPEGIPHTAVCPPSSK